MSMEQVIFKIDKKVKERAMKKAKADGTTYSAVLKQATQAYIENQFEEGLVYKPSFVRRILKADRGPIIRGDLKELIKKY